MTKDRRWAGQKWIDDDGHHHDPRRPKSVRDLMRIHRRSCKRKDNAEAFRIEVSNPD